MTTLVDRHKVDWLTGQIVIFDILEPPAFKKYSTCSVFQALCISVFAYLHIYYLRIFHLTHRNAIFYILDPHAFQKYSTLEV